MRKMQAVIAMVCVVLTCIDATGVSLAAEKTRTNSIGMEFMLIPAGFFMMGRDPAFEEGDDDERPQHTVNISKPFYLGKYEVTQAQWVAVMGNNPSRFKGRNNPVEHVSWHDVQEFIRRLNAQEGRTQYRLPTEAEWEYAARAGATTAYFFGDDKHALSGYAWYGGNSGDRLHPVGQKQPNAWGLYDVYGNVREWVQDWFVATYYASSPGTDPQGPSSGEYRVLRGGGWNDLAEHCRSADRHDSTPDVRFVNIGFRLAFSPE